MPMELLRNLKDRKNKAWILFKKAGNRTRFDAAFTEFDALNRKHMMNTFRKCHLQFEKTQNRFGILSTQGKKLTANRSS